MVSMLEPIDSSMDSSCIGLLGDGENTKTILQWTTSHQVFH